MGKKLILDYSKWRCGGSGNYKLGEGRTLLENKEGFQCCLGQFALQLLPSLTREDIVMKEMPNSLSEEIPLLSHIDSYHIGSSIPSILNYVLTDDAIEINDEICTTPEQKIIRLKELFLKSGYEIEVINKK